MKKSFKQVLLSVGLVVLTGCAALDTDNVLHTDTRVQAGEVKNKATLRILPYVDQRTAMPARLLGVNTTRVVGLSGKELRLDHDVSDVVTLAIQNQFRAAGFEVTDVEASQSATFEVSGSIKNLVLNSKDRDDANIVIETSVKEIASGKVIWSASVAEKSDRFAGVSGNTRADLVGYLNHELRVVSGKTVEAVNKLLMASYPALFNLAPGTQTIAGVTVHSVAIIAPAAPTLVAAPPVAVVTEQAATGALSITSKPARAKVYLDEVYFGLTPLRVELDAGVHKVEVKLDDHKGTSEKVSVRKGETTELELNLKH